MTLGRTIWFFVKLGLLVAAAVWLANHPGIVVVDWFGQEITLAVGTALAVLVVLILVLYVIWRIWHVLRRAPADFGLFRRSRRQAKGFRALTRGLVAVAAGDAAEAKRLARTAHGLLERSPLTLLLAAQASQLEGDEHAAMRYFEALAKNPEAALLGLRGLTTAALKRGDETAALGHAETALRSHPHAEWAAETAHRLQVKHGRPADESLKALVRGGAMSAKQGQRRRAVLLADKARVALLAETADPDLDTALRSAREALKLDATLVPARLILANLLIRMGKRREAMRLIEQDWDTNPHPLLARAYIEAEPGERPLERMKRLERLQRQNPDHPESHRALASAALAAGLWGEARRHLERLVEAERAGEGLSLATCRAMAALEDAEQADPATLRRWLDEAGHALPDPAWICTVCGHPGEAGPGSGHWQAVCPHCGSIDSYRWQRPVLPTGDLLQAPGGAEPMAATPGTATEAGPVPPGVDSAPVAVAANAAQPAAAPGEAPRDTGAAAEQRLETQMAPSVDAARSIY